MPLTTAQLTTLKAAILAATLIASFAAGAQTLKPGQLATACTACKADAACNTPRQIGDAVSVLNWLNAARNPASLAWSKSVPFEVSDEAPSYTAYDTLSQGKRDSWVRFLATTRDFSRNKVRNWVTDIWGNATGGSNAESILQAGTFNATNVQFAIGGNTKTTGTVSALDLTYSQTANQDDANWIANPANCQ